MQQSLKSGFIFRFIVTLLMFGFVLKNEYDTYFHQVLYGAIVYMPLYFVILGVFVFIVIFDSYSFAKTKQKKVFLPTVLGLLLIFSSVCIHFTQQHKLKQKNVFKATTGFIPEKDFKYTIEFKSNGTYVIFEGYPAGVQTNFYYGTYAQKHLRFRLNKQYGEHLVSNYFKVVTVKNYSQKTKLELVQTDREWNELKNQVKFKFTTYK